MDKQLLLAKVHVVPDVRDVYQIEVLRPDGLNLACFFTICFVQYRNFFQTFRSVEKHLGRVFSIGRDARILLLRFMAASFYGCDFRSGLSIFITWLTYQHS